MRLLHTLLLSTLFALSNAAAIEKQDYDKDHYDAIIVGGGPSGLAALSGLARVRRKVLLIDSGEYRNGPTRHIHDLLGFDGVTPAYYRYSAREQISFYETVSMTNGSVTSIVPHENNIRFDVTAMIEGKSKTLTARKIVLATGLRDILPETPGVQENWGKGIYWCPWCDGHEHVDQPMGLLGPLSEVADMVREISTLNTDLVAFVNGTDTPEVRAEAEKGVADYQTYLDLMNVKIDNRTIKCITRLRDGANKDADPSIPSVAEFDEFNVEFYEGEPVKRAVFFVSFENEQRSELGGSLGVHMYNHRLAANQTQGMMTNIDGVYAVGDANSDNSTNVPHALWSGKRSAVALHIRLAREDSIAQIAAAKGHGKDKREFHSEGFAHLPRDENVEIRSVWERMNPRDILYAGEFDQ